MAKSLRQPLPAGLRAPNDSRLTAHDGEGPFRPTSHVGRYAHRVSHSTTDGDIDGVLSFAVIDAYTDIVLRTGTEREWRQSREAAARDGEPGIIDDFDGRAVYVEDWRG